MMKKHFTIRLMALMLAALMMGAAFSACSQTQQTEQTEQTQEIPVSYTHLTLPTIRLV